MGGNHGEAKAVNADAQVSTGLVLMPQAPDPLAHFLDTAIPLV
jgi:hypothetical protein